VIQSPSAPLACTNRNWMVYARPNSIVHEYFSGTD
jgi:hypothetical protein